MYSFKVATSSCRSTVRGETRDVGAAGDAGVMMINFVAFNHDRHKEQIPPNPTTNTSASQIPSHK
jgi:hypothetical protein